jgi:DNA end-binding protein Ku
MASKAAPSFTGLRAWRTNTLTLPQFPLLRVAVGKAPMTERQKRIAANMVCPNDGGRVERRYVCVEGGEVLTDSECVKSYDGVVLDASELESIKSSGDSDVELVASVDPDTLHPEMFTAAHELWPKTRADAEGYNLIATYLRDKNRALVGTVVEDGTTKVMVVRWSPLAMHLVAHTHEYERNVRHGQIETVQNALAALDAPAPEMMTMAATIFDAMPSEFDFASVEDEYGERLEALVQAKREGNEVAFVSSQAPAAEPADLMAALRASVDAAQAAKADKAPAKAARKPRVKATA